MTTARWTVVGFLSDAAFVGAFLVWSVSPRRSEA